MNNGSKNQPLQGTPGATIDGERRRIGTVVHDDRGNAKVEWQDAPADYRRPVLEVADEPRLSLKNEESYDPYARRTTRTAPRSGNTTRTDLRKLSEWIKMMRELEERKRRGEDGGDDEAL
ncbi:MAG TPA: hypothetical protein VEU54_12495 [Steroidobacteraceae bacterium]|nr:hypothetical protein [Steroidobacteraceae bacterium]